MLSDLFTEAARRHASRLAVTDPGTGLTYGEVLSRATGTAEAFRRLRRGDEPSRVGLVASNSAEYVVCYVAVLLAGDVPFLIDSSFGPRELSLITEECGLDLLVRDAPSDGKSPAVPGDLLASGTGTLRVGRTAAPAERPMLLDDTEVCRFTSGTTGKPNCIEFSGGAVAAAAANWAEGTGLGADDRVACFAGLSNGLAFNTSLLSVFLTGSSLHLSRGLPTGGRTARLIESVGATRLVGFPALYESVLRRGLAQDVARRIEVAISSGAPLRPETKEAFASRTGVVIRNYYGVAEAGPLTFAHDEQGLDGLGPALPGVTLWAGTPGSPGPIHVVSESMGSRYLNAPGVFESRLDARGRYRTGDEGSLDQGILHITGRTGRAINVGGRKVDPVEVADVLRGVAGVHDVVVFEDTDQHGDSLVAAAVTGGASLDGAAVRDHCRERLAAFKVPTRVLVLDRLPVNSIGKPSLAALRELTAHHR
ncbi:class I adenylate-forming enzyme family protein [Streptomyces sp. NPDC060198]|uniref:class I adenylate-forming enzyme family protein n=1 Tax=Streptomyces sp. NPDC060198 TaxID=3347070 RepID=UPI0036600A55